MKSITITPEEMLNRNTRNQHANSQNILLMLCHFKMCRVVALVVLFSIVCIYYYIILISHIVSDIALHALQPYVKKISVFSRVFIYPELNTNDAQAYSGIGIMKLESGDTYSGCLYLK